LDVPVVIEVEAVVVVDPVFASQIVELLKGAGVAEQEIDIRVAGKCAGVENCGSLGVVLQLLVLVVVQPAESKLELVQSLGPG
jgi:hypothetical protein